MTICPNKAPHKYFYLLGRDNASSLWCIQFGSYDRQEVVFERQCYRDSLAIAASNLKIVSCGDTQDDIEALRAKLNYGDYI